MTAIITKLGTKLRIQALLSGTPLVLDTIRISSSTLNITGDETVLPSIVYNVPSSAVLKNLVNSNTAELRVTLDATVGNFPIGTVGVFTAAGDLFALVNYPGVGSKVASNPPVTLGNVKTLYFIMQDTNFNSSVNISIGNVLSGVMMADGSVVATGNFNLGANKLTNVALGTNPTDAATFGQVSEFATQRRWTRIITTTTAKTGDRLLADTTTTVFTVTLPASPVIGDEVLIRDCAGTFSINNLTIGRNGSTIDGAGSDKVLNVDDTKIQLVYYAGTWNTNTLP